MKLPKATAMVFDTTTKTFEAKDVQLDQVLEGEILVEIAYTTICTSDLHTYCGRRALDSPTILGHEIVGRIVQLPTAKKDYTGQALALGDLVTWCVYAFDEFDPMAEKGYPQKAFSLYKYGHHPFNDGELNGGFATHCLLKKGTAIFKLPPHISLQELAPLNCTHATIAGGLRLAGDVKDKTVLIYGAGMLGLSATAMATTLGAKHVLLCDINPTRLALGEEFGATTTLLNTLDTTAKKQLLDEANLSLDIVIDTTGMPAVMEEGIELLGIGGISIWIGAVFNQEATPINAEKIVRKLLTIRGLHNYTPQDLSTAIDFLTQNHQRFPFDKLVSAQYHLSELASAFDTANSGQHFRVGISPSSSN
ncbi:zinc-binding dehydrogenase [Myroides sp. DF42-4-2]|uniref:zinc-binding dehydrogenase n=1 Tax=unclassified Myroides TaxID=2642485 RepID=UPI0025778C99|nr:zinc-binding dehydrogenase [Myroides sp. DF42-4-2]